MIKLDPETIFALQCTPGDTNKTVLHQTVPRGPNAIQHHAFLFPFPRQDQDTTPAPQTSGNKLATERVWHLHLPPTSVVHGSHVSGNEGVNISNVGGGITPEEHPRYLPNHTRSLHSLHSTWYQHQSYWSGYSTRDISWPLPPSGATAPRHNTCLPRFHSLSCVFTVPVTRFILIFMLLFSR